MGNNLKKWLGLHFVIIFFTSPFCKCAEVTSEQQIRPKVYLAGPDVFYPNWQAIVKDLKATCERYGFEGIFPFDAKLDLSKYTNGKAKADAIFNANVYFIKICDGVLANITPFRGPGADPGTVWEMGAAYMLEKPIVGYSQDRRIYEERVLAKRAGEQLHDDNGIVVEEFGLPENLMVACGSVDVVYSFEDAARSMASLLKTTAKQR